MVVSASIGELWLLMGVLKEAINSVHAIPDDEWVDLVGQPSEVAMSLIEPIATIVERWVSPPRWPATCAMARRDDGCWP